MYPEISKKYDLVKALGKGGFAKIFKAIDKSSKKEYALKIFDKELIKYQILDEYFDFNENAYKEILSSIQNEIQLMKMCKSENVVEFYEYFETEKAIVLVLELCDCNLKDYIIKNNYDLEFIQKVFKGLNNAIKFLNQNKIIHRDIKLENILLKYKDKEGNLIPKLADFGVSILDKKNIFNTQVGTFHYMAPEVLKDETYNNKCDLYSLGVSLYVSAFKQFPFNATSEIALIHKIKNQHFLKKTGIESFDDLIKKLLEFDPDKRISMEGYLNHPFFNEDPKNLKQFKLYNESSYNKEQIFSSKINVEIKDKNDKIKKEEIEKEKEKEEIKEEEKNIIKENEKVKDDKKKKEVIKEKEEIKEDKDEIKENIKKLNEICQNAHDIMEIANEYTQKKENFKISNILYYDENIEKHLDSIHEDSDYFERKTPGAFVLCTNLLSLRLVMEEIKIYNTKRFNISLFNLIVTGSKFQKIIDFLIENNYEELFLNICIYCMEIDKYSHLSKKYNKIKGVYNDQEQVIKFIEEISSEKIRPFPIVKIISYFDYKDKYHDRHEKISEFYGNLTKETYKEISKKMEQFIENKTKDDLRIEKEDFIESLKAFNISRDLDFLHKLVIKEYTKDTYYSYLNNRLKNLDKNDYEIISYYTSRLMYALNYFALKYNCFYTKNITLYRGEKKTYSNLLPFERLKGKIILFSSFISTSEDKNIAIDFSGRLNSEKIYKAKQYFSVIYQIKNYSVNSTVPCGVNVQSLSKHCEEKEILFQPFSFYLVKNVKFNYKKYTADIDLEIIPKKEIFEEKIQKGAKIIYNKKLNLMVIDENKKK